MEVRVACMDKKSWWLVNSYLFICVAFLMVLAMTSQTWYYTSLGSDYHGGLLRFEDQEFYKYYYGCNNYYDCTSDTLFDSKAEEPLKKLFIGGVIYILGTSVSLIALFSSVVVLGLDALGRFDSTRNAIGLVWVAWFSNTLGFTIWALLAKVTLGSESKCDGTIDEGVCLGEGGVLALVLIFITFSAALLHTLVVKRIKKLSSGPPQNHI